MEILLLYILHAIFILSKTGTIYLEFEEPFPNIKTVSYD
jgi:hypothetical protein